MFTKKPDGAPYLIGDNEKSIGTPAALAPSAYANTAEANYSIINEWLTMKGDLESEADILIRGKVFGNIKCKMLIIDAGAHVEGGIEADEVVVRGSTKGIMLAKRVRLEKSADVDSEIHHQSFSAEEGAKIKGALRYAEDMSKRPVISNDNALKSSKDNGVAAH